MQIHKSGARYFLMKMNRIYWSDFTLRSLNEAKKMPEIPKTETLIISWDSNPTHLVFLTKAGIIVPLEQT